MKTSSKPKLEWTSDYSIFEMHPRNRPLHQNIVLENSMETHGFMPSSPLQCVKNGNGKLKVIRGHHRLSIAKKLNIPVCYVIDETNTDIFNLEGASTGAWNVHDFAYARARAGDKDIQYLVAFKERHGLTMAASASIIGGDAAGSCNKVENIKSGKFRVADLTHAKQVVAITDMLRSKGVPFATSGAFVAALSNVILAPGIDYDRLVHRAETHYHILTKRGTASEYLNEIESLYNYSAKGNRFPVAFKAAEAARARSACNRRKN